MDLDVRLHALAASCALATVPREARAVEPDVDAVAWTRDVGDGIAFKDTGNALGENAFVGYAGYRVDEERARAWVNALYLASLRGQGVRYLFAVKGPDHPLYRLREI